MGSGSSRPPRAEEERSKQRSFAWKIGLRMVAISLLLSSTVYLSFTEYWLSSIWTGLAALGLFFNTLKRVNRSERKMAVFLESLRQNDFAVSFSTNEESGNLELQEAFQQLTGIFQKLRSQRESQHQLLQAIVTDAAVPLICFEEANGSVYLINEAAKSLFGLTFLRNIDAISRVDKDLPEALKQLDKKMPWKLVTQDRVVQLSLSVRQLIFEGKALKLVALTDVTSELAAREAEAWQKLLRVLTHEISNSAIPLSTLSSHITGLVAEAESEKRELSEDERKDVLEGLHTIDQRSRSLKQFVSNFKSINQIPEPDMASVHAAELIQEIGKLFGQDLEKENITLKTSGHEGVTLRADRGLTMLVLINLVRNAIESMANMKENKLINVTVEKTGHFVLFHIADSGCGIPPEDLEQIFIPFYSTKKGGSGIGLSIAHQIMQKQKGDLSVTSQSGKGSVFTVSFLG